MHPLTGAKSVISCIFKADNKLSPDNFEGIVL